VRSPLSAAWCTCAIAPVRSTAICPTGAIGSQSNRFDEAHLAQLLCIRLDLFCLLCCARAGRLRPCSITQRARIRNTRGATSSFTAYIAMYIASVPTARRICCAARDVPVPEYWWQCGVHSPLWGSWSTTRLRSCPENLCVCAQRR
jgi:hypothetical protein